ncbi:MAG: hypothetical protein NVSMB62_20770 [Acidobacteriaceae bacterium]
MSQVTRSILFLVVILSALTSPLLGQSATGEINGLVKDPTGAVIEGATVELTNQGTQIRNSTVSNQSGFFSFINVQPGRYVLSATKEGFAVTNISEFDLAVNQTLNQSITLSVGSVGQSVTVSTSSAMLQASSSELGTVIDQSAVHDLPLNGRNFTQLLTLTPGATPVSTAQGGISSQDAGVSSIPGSSFSKPSLHGQQNRSTMYYLDGIINTDIRGSIYGVLPMVDLIQEFKVQSHNDKAEFGGVEGGIVNVVSKSGTNKFHGAAWEYLRNNYFDARDPIADRGKSGPPPFRQNEFGATLGGPILRDKLFFYGGYEGWRYTKPTQSLAYIPTAAELSGDFTQSLIAHDIYNPYSTRMNPANPKQYIRDRFMCDAASGNPLPASANGMQAAGVPCNKIPKSLISSQMSGLFAAYLASPNYNGDPTHNYIENRATTDNANNFQVKVDGTLSPKDNAFIRVTEMFVNHNAPVTGVKEQSPSAYHAYNFGGGLYHTFSPRLVADIEGGILLKPYHFNQAQADAGIAPLKTSGFVNPEQFGGVAATLSGPWIGSFIGNTGESIRKNPVWNVAANLSFVKGKHNLRVGYQLFHVQRVQVNLQQTYSFTNTPTANPLSQGTTGASLATALIGLPSSYNGQLPKLGEVDFQYAQWAAYVQDEWRIKSNFTLNLGLRYDIATQPSIIGNRLSNGLDLNNQQWLIGAAAIPACGDVPVNPCIPGGIGSVPFNDHITFVNKKNFMSPAIYDNVGPRAGFAWQFHPKDVLRGGYGLLYDPTSARSQYAQNDIEGASWPWTTGFGSQANNIGAQIVPITQIEGNFPTPLAPPSPWTSGGYFDDPQIKDSYSHQWNLELQRQMTPSLLMAMAYVGSSNGRLPYTGYANAAMHPSPNGTPLTTIDTFKQIPFLNPGIHYSQSIGTSNYNALEAKLQRSFTNGFQMLLSYTWSKSIDDSSGFFGAENGIGGGSAVQNYFDRRSNRSVSSYDIPQFVSLFTDWQIPVGHGQKYLSSGVSSWVLGNWELNSIVQARSGQPFNLGVNGGDVANIGGSLGTVSGYERPNIVGTPYPLHRTASQWYNPAAFAIPVASFGNFGRNSLRTDHVFNADLSILKNIPVKEFGSVQFRSEFFNVFNIQSLGAPNTTIGQAGAGIVTLTASTPRQMQFALRVTF